MATEIARLIDRVIEPSSLLPFLILAGVVAIALRRWKAALFSQLVAVAIVLLFGLLPGDVWLALPLEERFPANPDLSGPIEGIIVLGGTERVEQSAAWHQPILSDPAPIVALVALSRRFPDAKVVFTGGTHPRRAAYPTEADIVQQFLRLLGVDQPNRIIYEKRSHNTLDNARFTRDLVQPNPNQRWILVTEAISMPRAVAVFRHAGWSVIPFPAGYATKRDGRLSLSLDLASGLQLASLAMHEW